MDVALRLQVKESPLSLTSQSKASITVTKHILSIDSSVEGPASDYTQETIYFTSVKPDDAEALISGGNVNYDAILIPPELGLEKIQSLKEIAQSKAIPLVLYTRRFDATAKEIALKIGVDEYQYGVISYAFLKRVEFIKKLKVYKNTRGDKPYTDQQMHDEINNINLWTFKRAFDILISFLLLLTLSPVMLLIAILIKLESKGPVFYVSKRAGAGYKIFDFYKFRSMYDGADGELNNLAHLNQYSENDLRGVFYKIKDDPRVTKVGRFIRNTSLDELPQLINVLKGDMSLVGNRPLPLYEAEKLTCDQIAWRFLAPAGITGLWQVTKRGKDNMSPEERIALDTEYAMKNSLWLDVKILFCTIPALLQKEKV